MTMNAVQLLLLDLALILVLARLFGAAARRLGQPPVIGEILAGIMLGPSLFSGAITRHLFPMELRPPLTAVADLGLALFMFIIGYELDRTLIRGRERIAASVSLGSIALPMSGGFLLGLWLAHRDHVGRPVPFALFVGAAMSVTAFPVLARIITDRNMQRTRIGGLTIASAAVDDIVAWTLLAVVVTIAGANNATAWHILLAPLYVAVMLLVVRPTMRWVADRYGQQRLTPDVLAVFLVFLLLSASATEWMGINFIFGAFLCGAIMPRENAAPLRESILERLEQISVLLLLPVFFVVAGLGVDLSKIDMHGLVELLAILGVAIGGKFLGAYLGARSAGVHGRQAGVLATLMNTRGLTELVILTIGLQIGVLNAKLFSLMVLMAIVTTAMTGPLVRIIYPPHLIERDIADAERAALAAGNAYRVLVVVDSDDDQALVDAAIDLARPRQPAEVVLSRLMPQNPARRLEVGAGLGADLLVMTTTMQQLHALAARCTARGVGVRVHSQFSDDVATDLTKHVLNASPDLLVLPAATELAPSDFLPRVVVLRSPGPAQPTAVAVRVQAGADAAAALQVAAQIAVSRGVGLVLTGENSRLERSVLADLIKFGISVTRGELPEGALIVGGATDADAHLIVRARPNDMVDDVDEWAGLMTAGRQS